MAEKELPKQVRLDLAIDEYQKAFAAHQAHPYDHHNPKPAVKPIAFKYGIIPSTLYRRIAGKTHPYQDAHKLQQRLNPVEEQVLKSLILGMTELGSPLKVSHVRYLAAKILIERGDHRKLGINWVSKFLERHPDLSSQYNKRVDEECAAPPTSSPRTPLVLGAPQQQRDGQRGRASRVVMKKKVDEGVVAVGGQLHTPPTDLSPPNNPEASSADLITNSCRHSPYRNSTQAAATLMFSSNTPPQV